MGITEGKLEKRGKYWHWRYRVDGVQKSQSLKVSQISEARRIRQALIAEYNEAPTKFVQGEINPKVDEFWKNYIEWAEEQENLRPSTVSLKRLHWGYLIDSTGAAKVKDITPEKVERFKASLIKSGPNGTPLSRTTANEMLKHLQAIFALGLKKGWYTGDNPVKDIKRYKVTKRRRTRADFLTEEEVSKLIEAARDYSQNMHWLFLLLIYAGLRKNEAVNTRWEWLDFDKKKIALSEHEGFQLKDAEERIIPMHSNIRDALKPHAQPEGFLFESSHKSEGKWRYRWDPIKSFQNVAKKAEVEYATFQLCRITFGSLLVQKNVGIIKVSEWMGHSDIKTTQKYYAGLSESDDDIDRI